MSFKILLFFIIVIVSKSLYNLYYYSLAKYYYQKYVEFIKRQSKSWFIKEHRQKIIKLFEKSGIQDTFESSMEPAGYGYLATKRFSVFNNLSVQRRDIVEIINGDFREAIGVYKQRIVESFNPIYWIESFFTLPKIIFRYVGIKSTSIFIKIFQLIWWVIVAISTLAGIFFNAEFTGWIRNL